MIIASLRGFATIQDGGRRGHLHEGVPRGGAMIPELLAQTNAAIGNAWDAPAIELFGSMTLSGAGRIATDGVVHDVDGDHATRARYVAIEGGVDAPLLLDGRGALVGAGIGRALREGDALRTLNLPRFPPSSLPALEDRTIRIIAGPDLARFDAALQALDAEWTISNRRDRTGTRLDGPRLERVDADGAASTPMVRGAIQVPGGGAEGDRPMGAGELIVLGPDHPTTGGYPVVAVVARVDLGRFAMRKTGERVRFEKVAVDVAQRAWRAHARVYFA